MTIGRDNKRHVFAWVCNANSERNFGMVIYKAVEGPVEI